MIRAALTAAACLMLAACGGGGGGGDRPEPIPAPAANGGWQAGPTLGVRGNYSKGTVLTETAEGLVIDIPQQGQGETHYVTKAGSLVGAKALHIRAILTGKVEPVGYPQYQTPRLTAYFQRSGDNWSCAGKYDPYRWYATTLSQVLDHEGVYDFIVPLDQDVWTGCQSTSRANNRAEFDAAIAGSATIGIVFGGGDGFGHGVFAIGTPARVVVTFEVQ